ncbi:MAG TPA: hypothetical protein VHN36_07640 [Ilumatobacteraceae bacterium]|nr:hypothetical protein [Ilumatobacteraceae bacterium]
MNTNPVRSAVDLVDAEPSTEFLIALRARLLADGSGAQAATAQQPSASASETVEEYVMLAPGLTRTGPNRRVYKVLLAAAACVAVLAAIVVIKRSNDPEGEGGLRDVDPREALPLGQATQVSPDDFGASWSQVDDFTGSTYADLAAATNAAMPACAQLKSFGLMQPTTKSVLFHEDFLNGSAPMLRDVWVFATKDDASRAMDVIDGDVYPTCFFDFYDRLTTLLRVKATSTSQSFDLPPVAPHGDRQVIIGQKIDYSISGAGGLSVEAVNAYVQVGRAIAFIDPQYFSDVGPNSNVEQAITVSTDALKKVFGQ